MMFMNILLYYRELSLFCHNILNPVLIHIEYIRSVQKKSWNGYLISTGNNQCRWVNHISSQPLQAGSVIFFFLFSITGFSLLLSLFHNKLCHHSEYNIWINSKMLCTSYKLVSLFHHCPSGVKPRSSSCNRLPSNANAAQASKEDDKKLQVEQTGAKGPLFISHDTLITNIVLNTQFVKILHYLLNTQLCLMHDMHTEDWLIACYFVEKLKEANGSITIVNSDLGRMS